MSGFRYAVLALTFATPMTWAKAFTYTSANGLHELEFEIDAYYSAVDYIGSLNESPIPELTPDQEQGVYEHLLQRSLSPRYFIVEASFNPLPFTGAMLQTHATEQYHRMDIGHGNAIQSLTAGFPEPWAFSCFWGNVVNFVTSDSLRTVTGKGYSGLLLSVGNYHLLSGHFIEEKWAEGEVKLKGSDIRPGRRLSWSFRAGGRLHGELDILNTLYLSVKRDRVDMYRGAANENFWKYLLFRNSEIEARADMILPRSPYVWDYFASGSLLLGKKWPSDNGNWAFALGLGLLYQAEAGYRGELADLVRDQDWSLIFRPNIVF